jgi:hypothetical protein
MPKAKGRTASVHTSPARSRSRAAASVPATVPMWGATVFLTIFTLVLSLFAFIGQSGLISSQIQGAEEVVASLKAEATVLDQQAALGKVPLAFLQAEKQHIADQTSEETDQLESLKGNLGR